MTLRSDPTTAKGIMFCLILGLMKKTKHEGRKGGKGRELVKILSFWEKKDSGEKTNSDSLVELSFFGIILFVVERVCPNIMMSQFCSNLCDPTRKIKSISTRKRVKTEEFKNLPSA